MSDTISHPASGLADRARSALRDVPDFPAAGILFKDITPLLADGPLLADVTRGMAQPFGELGITHVAGVESRGFILGAAVALHLGVGFVPIRKPGKLPWKTIRRAYTLEYGTAELEAHTDACPGDSRVLIVDDVLATGGTAEAACALVEQMGATVVGCSFLLEITALHGRARLVPRLLRTLLAT